MDLEVRGVAHTIAEFDRDEFVTRRFIYKNGQHAFFCGSTQSGKTTLAFQLLRVHASPDRPVMTLVMKPEDPTIARWRPELGHRLERGWPPTQWPWQSKPAGWFVQPRYRWEPTADAAIAHDLFKRVLVDAYNPRRWKRRGRTGPRIVFADEIFGLDRELKLREHLVAILSRGGGMGVGLWSATQQPQWCATQVYNSFEHGFFYNEPDRRNRDRVGEIGGFNTDLVKAILERLDPYHALYLRRTGRVMCIVRP